MNEATITHEGGEINLWNVHDEANCSGEYCIIHNPVVPTEYRSLNWRDDIKLFEEICSCGIGHPTIEDRLLHDRLAEPRYISHGCCGKPKHCNPHGRARVFRSSRGDWIVRNPLTPHNKLSRFLTQKEAMNYATNLR